MIEKEPSRPDTPKSSSRIRAAIKTSNIEASNGQTKSIQAQSMQHSRYELLSGFLDGELTQQEAQKVMLLLDSDAKYKTLYDEMLTMRQEVQSLSLQESELAYLDQLHQEPLVKTSRLFGFVLFFSAAVILIALLLYSVFINMAISLLVKISIGLLAFGSLLLFYSVLRQRVITQKNDKYNRVKI